MKPLSLEHVNTVSPYFVESTNNIGFYQFSLKQAYTILLAL